MRWLLVLLAACGGSASPPSDDLSCDAHPDPHCANPIDRIMVPKLRAIGLEPADASPDEVCRRMAIDLLGRGPTGPEAATCRTQTFAQMAQTFLATDGFVRTQRRAWAELAHFESLLLWSPELADLDGLVAQLYRGELGYADFVRRYAVHPAFYGLHPDDSWIANVFALFVGRTARQDEIDAARPLTTPWGANTFAGREAFWNHYQIALANGASETDATTFGNTQAYNGARLEWGVNLCKCAPGLLDAGCTTDVFGDTVTLAPICIGQQRDPVNLHRLIAATPSTDDTCPDGSTHRPECADRGRGPMQNQFVALDVWSEAPADVAAELRKIGDALVSRDDVWEAAADRELKKLVGWWQATFKHPESDVPEVRALLAQMLHDGTPVRDVIAMIATSQLYVRPVAAPAGVDPDTAPQWAAGPAKLLAGESWFASAAVAVGETPGSCDFRWGQGNDYAPQWVYPALVESTPSSFEGRLSPGYTIQAIQRLGGCTGDAKHVDVSNVGLAFSEAAIARELCAVSGRLDATDDLGATATHLAQRAWNRELAPDDLAAIVGEMQACIAAGGTTGCADATVAARWLCQRLLDSAPFGTY